jgi:peptide/nickel transport system permease protein
VTLNPIAVQAALPDEPATVSSSPRSVLRAFRANRVAILGAAYVILLVLFCFVGPLLHPTNQTNGNAAILSSVPQNGPPSLKYLFGTDNNSFDEMGRVMFGGQADIEVALAAALIATILGVIWGAIAGYVGGVTDTVMMRLVDAILSIPGLLLLVVLADIFHPSTVLLILLVGFVAWLVPARLVRGETLTLRTREYVQAVKVAGGSARRVVFRHIIPNAIGTILVNASFQIADAILFLATLGYLGLGIQPPGTDWGTMLSTALANGALQNDYWWEILAPGFAIMSAVVAFNFIGDGLRNALEVRLRP